MKQEFLLTVLVCGPPKYSELRINFTQAFNAIGAVIGPVLASYVFFEKTGDSVNSLKNVQWVTSPSRFLSSASREVFFISNIPGVTDADMERQARLTHLGEEEKPFWKHHIVFHAAFAQFCYRGAQGQYFSSRT